MEMALLDERGVGGSQDVKIVDPGERLALDGLPVSLTVACAVVAHDRFRRQADADFWRTATGSGAQGFGQGAGARELASGGVHAEGEFGNVAGQQHGGDSQERNLRSLVVLLEDQRRNYQHCKGYQVDGTVLWEGCMQQIGR